MTQNTDQTNVISPGATIGILGGGQLGRMMTIAAKHMGYRVQIYSNVKNSPAGQVADAETQGSFDDLAAIKNFANSVDVVTIETENIPTECFDTVSRCRPSFPGIKTLEVCQNRSREKQFLADNNIPTAKFKIVQSEDELRAACQEIMPGVLKTTTGGYDGKGQFVVQSPNDVETAWKELKAEEAILEEWIEYDFEFSIVGVRSSDGSMDAYPSIRNEHENGILDVSISPSGLATEINSTAAELTHKIMNELGSVGVLTVEFFFRGGEVLVNEMAPRPHNSGHLTIEGHVTNQFEQHVRAVCGIALGSTQQLQAVAMANLLGNEWSDGEPKWHQALSLPETKLHLYGKVEPKLNRKMGHLTSFADDPEQAKQQVLAARKLLTACTSNELLSSGKSD